MNALTDTILAPAVDAPSSAAAGQRFALLVAWVVVIFFVAENFRRIKALPRQITQDKRQIAAWVTFLIFTYAGYIYQPEADDPSVTITFGAGIQLFSLCLLYAMPRKQQACPGPTGDSAEFALLLALSLGLRLSSTTRFLGYLPTDATGDGCYQAIEMLSVVIALRGLCGTGLTGRQGLGSVAVVGVCMLASLVCYGDLDRRVFWDRVYATGIYVEVCSWAFIMHSIWTAGPERTIKPAFILPAIAHACCRASFWFIAQDEMIPRRPIRLMAYYPVTIVVIHFALAGALLVMGLLICCAPEPDLGANPKKVNVREEQEKDSEPLMGLMSAALGAAGTSAAGLAPVRAVWENGQLRVEYASGFKEEKDAALKE